MTKSPSNADPDPPFDTVDLGKNLKSYLDMNFVDPVSGWRGKLGNVRWGVYAFFDYDSEPIYVGQTNESLRTRIQRHLTNQRTDAVAMSVLDPFEVLEVEVWPLPQYQDIKGSGKFAREQLDSLELAVFNKAIAESSFKAILNEKNPRICSTEAPLPKSVRGRIVSDQVLQIRAHPDLRLARRALIISKLAQVIAERKVQGGLRRVLLTQSRRLALLAETRYVSLGGETSVEVEGITDDSGQISHNEGG